MAIELQPHAVPVFFGILPSSFEEQVAGRMFYLAEGDNIVISKDSLNEAHEDFQQTELCRALHEAFNLFPIFNQIVLHPV